MRKIAYAIAALILLAWPLSPLRADTFAATYRELARSPANYATTWFDGAVTRDGKFVYGLGHSHNSYGNNSLWLYDPATNTHKNLQPNTGNKWLWDKDANNQAIAKSGRWADPTIRALTNRNNHQAFSVPWRDEFWVLSGTTFYQSSPYFGGRFNLESKIWAYLSPPWAEKTRSDLADFSDGVVAGMSGWVAPNAGTAVCPTIETVVLFGGMNDTGGVRIIEPNPAGPEPMRWSVASRPPFHLPAENMRHNAACVGDTVYFVEGQRRVPNVKCCETPDPAQFWKFHVPSRTWTRLPDGPPGGYFGVLTADTTAQALLLYGGSAGNKLWAYDLIGGQWQNLTGTVPNLPRADMHTGGFIPGFGHVYKGGRRFTTTGADIGYGASSMFMAINLTRTGEAPTPPAEPTPPPTDPSTEPTDPSPAEPDPTPTDPPVTPPTDPTEPTEPTPIPPTEATDYAAAIRAKHAEAAAAITAAGALLTEMLAPVEEPAEPAPAEPTPNETDPTEPTTTPNEPPPAEQTPTGAAISWTQIPLATRGVSPVGSMKHQRLVEGPDGRVYTMGGDWGGDGGENTGRQEVFSFDPLSATGDWRLEAPYCGTTANPVHWHTDEAGVAWDAKRGVFWKLAGTEYGPEDSCLAEKRSVKAKAITFDPATRLWTVPPHVAQTRFGYVANGVLDPVKDQMVQIIDKSAKHLDLITGQWATYPLPGDALRFNAIVARSGRTLWWLNRNEVLESYDLDTHALKGHGVWPFGAQSGWATAMTMIHQGKVLSIWPTSLSTEAKRAALYDPATKQWTKLDMGAARGNTAMMHSSGRVVLMGGMAPPEDHNKFVWVGTVR